MVIVYRFEHVPYRLFRKRLYLHHPVESEHEHQMLIQEYHTEKKVYEEINIKSLRVKVSI